MNKILKFILVGTLFATVGEFLLNIFVTNTILLYLGTWIFYPAYLVFVYFSSKIIDVIFKRKVIADVTYYFVYGFIGLMLEWFGNLNSPWANPSANQIGMFCFWVALSFMPRIFIDERKDLARLKKWSLVYLVSYFLVILTIGLLLPLLSLDYFIELFYLIWLFAIGYLLMHVFYIWYFIKNLKSK